MIEISIYAIIQILLISVLIYLAYIDIRTLLLPDVYTLPLILSGVLFNGTVQVQFVTLDQSIMGAIFGYFSLWSLNTIYRKFRKQEGIGMGDAKLFAALGAWLGLNSLPSILLIASLTGIAGGFMWIQFHRQKMGSVFPFGPFLIFAGIMEMLWPQIIQNTLMNYSS